MDVAKSLTAGLLPDMSDVMRNADPKRRGAAIRQIGQLFAKGAPHFTPAHVALFDEVFIALVPHSDPAARAELAEQIAALANAPPQLVKQLVTDNLIAICGPILGRSPLIDEPTLIDIARMKGQPHLLAISGRATLTHGVTDVIVRRGDREVVRNVAGNAGAAFSSSGYDDLIRRAGEDGALALTIGQRDDISDAGFKALLAGSVDLVRRRLLAAASPARRALAGQTAEVTHFASLMPRDFGPAQRTILAMHRAGSLDEPALFAVAARNEYETTVAALSALSGVSIATIDHLMCGERHDPVLVLGRAIGLDWSTVRALISVRPGDGKLSTRALDDARDNYERLLRPTAQRVLSFWRSRQPDMIAS